jgi:predicted acylesterase/phospholipase RssA
MANLTPSRPHVSPLLGARIWLSGSVPRDAEPKIQDSILAFVRGFCDRVFRDGGTIIHGCHPSLRSLLLERARLYREGGGTRNVLTFVCSRWYANHVVDEKPQPDDWRRDALGYETPEVEAGADPGPSLRRMREWITARCDAVVVIGGRWWAAEPGRAGIPEELELTRDRGLPCFLLGGFGGAAAGYLDANPQLLGRLKNGLDPEQNRRLATDTNAATLVDQVVDQLGRLPLVHGQSLGGTSFRILALDGGGIKGTFTAAVLAQLQTLSGQPVGPHFDLIAGTSTGGILAIGLGLGVDPQKILDFYRERGPKIFPLTSFGDRIFYRLRHLLVPKFAQRVLLEALREAYPRGAKLGDSNNRLVIPSCVASNGRAYLFRTPHHPDLSRDAHREAAQVALATAAAPTYFAAAQVSGLVAETQFVDGGVWANNPALAAVVEAVRWLSVPLDRIEILSIGTTATPFSARAQARAGLLGWGGKAVELLMNAQANGTNVLANALAQDVRMLRIDETLAPGVAGIDNISAIPQLAGAGAHAASDPATLAQVKERFLNGIPAEDWRKTVGTASLL